MIWHPPPKPWRSPTGPPLDDAGSLTELRCAADAAFEQPLQRRAWRTGTYAPTSIAILPFVNIRGDAEEGYLADGITEDIITDLSRIPVLSVASSGASSMYRGGPVHPSRIAEELGVGHLLEGSVRKAGQKVRVTARLTDAHTNRQVWAERYDRELSDLFELQSELAAAIVGALRLNLPPAAPAAPAREPRRIEAYDEMLRARAFLHEMTRRSIELACEGLARAITIDPRYAEAHAGLAQSVAVLCFHHGVGQWAEAIAHPTLPWLDPGLAGGYSARGFATASSDGFFTPATEADFDTAIRLDPQLYEAHLYRGLCKMVQGDAKSAVAGLSRAFDLNALDLQSGMMLILCVRKLERRDEMQAVCPARDHCLPLQDLAEHLRRARRLRHCGCLRHQSRKRGADAHRLGRPRAQNRAL